jgi:hypothetical protein
MLEPFESTATPCSAVAVFDEPNAAGAAAARIFFYGALFGVFLTVLIEIVPTNPLTTADLAPHTKRRLAARYSIPVREVTTSAHGIAER